MRQVTVEGDVQHEPDLGGFMYTWSGKKFYPLHPELLEVDIQDIAHALSRNNRYGGHLDCELYSVAQHSCLVEDISFRILCENHFTLLRQGEEFPDIKMFRKQALLHDVGEGILIDMPKPIKRILPDYEDLEWDVQAHLLSTLGVNVNIHHIIKNVDRKIRLAEAHCLSFGWDLAPFMEGMSSQEIEYYMSLNIRTVSANEAKEMFLNRYEEIISS